MNVGNGKCPGHGPDARPRESVADNHAFAVSEHGLGTTATLRGAREVSPGVVPVLPAEGISRGAEVEAGVTEGGGPRIEGVAGEAIGEKARTDVRKSHEQMTRGLS